MKTVKIYFYCFKVKKKDELIVCYQLKDKK